MAGPVATPTQAESFYSKLRVDAVDAVDGTTLCVPDEEAVTREYRKHIGEV
ncbi:hypothetical protein [Streptomyces sp. NPDC046805]|uniref:hypothetical protein n=1 Tax=Streptomyces sp. NPDC046805 TaxID=3155134 RepID=UPI0033C0DE9D